jgi:hypothetical protein
MSSTNTMRTFIVPAQDYGDDFVRFTIKLKRKDKSEQETVKMWRDSINIQMFIYQFYKLIQGLVESNGVLMQLETSISDKFNDTNKVFPRKVFGDKIHINLAKFTNHYKLDYDAKDVNEKIRSSIMDTYRDHCKSKKMLLVRIDLDE